MLLLRVELPDRPGSLGEVASAMGTVNADILAVEIVEKNDGTVIDDFMLDLPLGVMPDSLVSACTQLGDVRVLWLSHYPESWGLLSDIELINDMAEDPDHAAEILVDAAPVVFHCHWAMIINRATQQTIESTSLAPELTPEQVEMFGGLETVHATDLGAGWLPQWGEATCSIAPLRHKRAIVLGRQGGPAWLTSELMRLRFLGTMAG